MIDRATTQPGDVVSEQLFRDHNRHGGEKLGTGRHEDGVGAVVPDLLVPFATLAWALGAPKLTARWITAVRRSPTPTQNFGFTIAYRQLRDEVGLLDENPLDDANIEEIYHEATDWLASL